MKKAKFIPSKQDITIHIYTNTHTHTNTHIYVYIPSTAPDLPTPICSQSKVLIQHADSIPYDMSTRQTRWLTFLEGKWWQTICMSQEVQRVRTTVQAVWCCVRVCEVDVPAVCFVCVCVCMYACMYVCVHVCMRACMYACMYLCVHACMCARMYVCMHACIYICMYVCMHVYMYVCVYVCMHACICVSMCVCMYVCMCVYVCVYVCIIYVYMSIYWHSAHHFSLTTELQIKKQFFKSPSNISRAAMHRIMQITAYGFSALSRVHVWRLRTNHTVALRQTWERRDVIKSKHPLYLVCNWLCRITQWRQLSAVLFS